MSPSENKDDYNFIIIIIYHLRAYLMLTSINKGQNRLLFTAINILDTCTSVLHYVNNYEKIGCFDRVMCLCQSVNELIASKMFGAESHAMLIKTRVIANFDVFLEG